MQTLIKPLHFFAIVGAVFLIALLFVLAFDGSQLFAAQTNDQQCPTENHYKTFSFFSATTTSATSTSDGSVGADVKCAKKVTLQFSHGGVATTSTGTSIFNVQVSPDEGTTWIDFNKLVVNLATSTTPTVLDRVTVGAATSTVMASLHMPHDTFSRVRCVVVETGAAGAGGEHTCAANIEF